MSAGSPLAEARLVRAALRLALAALMPGAPLAAQERADSEQLSPAPAEPATPSAEGNAASTTDADEAIRAALRTLDESPTAIPEPPVAAPRVAALVGPIKVINASPSVLTRVGPERLDPDTPFCLSDRETALLASERVSFVLTGEECISPTAAEFYAFKQELAVVNEQNLSEAIAANYAAQQNGDQADIDRAAARLREAAKQAPATIARLRQGGDFSISGRPGVYFLMQPRDPNPRRPRPIIFRVASGSTDVLNRFPRGTVVQQSMALCLSQGEQLTVAANVGQSATYTGPGCLRRQGRPSRDNIGAFTFG